jgi:hypothetical protein
MFGKAKRPPSDRALMWGAAANLTHSQGGPLTDERACRDCGKDISDLDGNARRCLDCRRSQPQRFCQVCGTDISDRHANAKYCYDHQPKPPAPRKPRACIDCGTDISHTHGLNKRCDDCRVAIMRNVGLEPLEPYPGPFKPWRSRCQRCKNVVKPQFSNIAAGWGGCHHCGSVASTNAKRLPEAEATAAMRAVGLEPLEPFTDVMTKWHCRCLTCGKVTDPLLNNIKKGQNACKWCTEQAVDPDEAAAVMRAAGFEPLVPYVGRHARWPCRCLVCGEIPSPTYGAIKLGGGCLYCAVPGFKPNEPAVVYLITHPEHDATKVGIMNEGTNRLAVHKRYGWQVMTIVHVPGTAAMAIEDAILFWWRNGLDLPAYLGPAEMPQGGWTETVATCEIDIAATVRRIREAAQAVPKPLESAGTAELATKVIGQPVQPPLWAD